MCRVGEGVQRPLALVGDRAGPRARTPRSWSAVRKSCLGSRAPGSFPGRLDSNVHFHKSSRTFEHQEYGEHWARVFLAPSYSRPASVYGRDETHGKSIRAEPDLMHGRHRPARITRFRLISANHLWLSFFFSFSDCHLIRRNRINQPLGLGR